MTESKKDSLVFFVTTAEEQPDRCTIPFVLGNAALAMDVEVSIVLQITGVYLVMKNYARHVHAAGFPPLTELMDAFIEGGGKILVCSPCLQSRHITPEDLIEGVDIVAGATVVNLLLEATNAVSY